MLSLNCSELHNILKGINSKIIYYAIQKIGTNDCLTQSHYGSQQFVQSVNDRNIDNSSNGFKNEAAQSVNKPDSNQSDDTNGKYAECFSHNTANCQKKKRNT